MIITFPDLSHWEPDVDFHAMKDGGVPCFITKASQGNNNVDETYADFHARGRSVGLIAGAFTFLNASDPAPQVAEFLSVSKLQKGDFQPIVDAEAAGLTRAQTVAAMRAFEINHYSPILYCSLSYFLNVMGSPTNWPLWLAAYRPSLPTIPHGVRLFAWQYLDHEKFAGVANPCDGNKFYGTLADLKKFTIC